jgi:spermidine synthase
MIDACIDKKAIITVDDIKKLIEKNPHIFDKIIIPESSTNLVQNQY